MYVLCHTKRFQVYVLIEFLNPFCKTEEQSIILFHEHIRWERVWLRAQMHTSDLHVG